MTGFGGTKPVRRVAKACLVAGGLLFSVAARGQDAVGVSKVERHDTFFVGLQAIDLSAGGAGTAGSLEWLHAFSPGKALNIGVFDSSVGGSRWTYGRVGATWKSFPRTTLHGEADLGSGKDREADFAYRIVRAGATRELIEKRLLVQVEDHYLNVGTVTGNIVKVGLTFFAAGSVSASAGVLSSTSGHLGTRALTARLDLVRNRFTLFSGFSAGRSQPGVFRYAPQTVAVIESSSEFFGGAAIPVGRQQQVTVVLDLLELPHGRRTSLSLGWKVPL